VEGIYKLGDRRIGVVKDFNPDEWYGHVTLDSMPENAEYGLLDEQATVDVDGKIYRKLMTA